MVLTLSIAISADALVCRIKEKDAAKLREEYRKLVEGVPVSVSCLSVCVCLCRVCPSVCVCVCMFVCLCELTCVSVCAAVAVVSRSHRPENDARTQHDRRCHGKPNSSSTRTPKRSTESACACVACVACVMVKL